MRNYEQKLPILKIFLSLIILIAIIGFIFGVQFGGVIGGLLCILVFLLLGSPFVALIIVICAIIDAVRNKEKKAEIFNTFFLNTHSSIPQYFPKRSLASLSESTPKKTDMLKSVQFPSSGLSNHETLILLRSNLQKRFMENNFVDLAVETGLPQEEANSLFKQLVDQGALGVDPEGFWRWISQ